MENKYINKMDEKSRAEYNLAQNFIRCYKASRDGLTQMGILRSERVLQGDYAEWVAAKILGLKVVDNPVQAGYDAVKGKKKYQIKARIVNQKTLYAASFDFGGYNKTKMKTSKPFDVLIGVYFTDAFEMVGMIEVAYKDVVDMANSNKGGMRFRWNKTVAKDKRVKVLFWDEGVLGDVDVTVSVDNL